MLCGTMPHVVQIIERLPTAAEYRSLRRAVGWKVPDAERATGALEASAGAVVAEVDGAAIGMGRIVGDLTFYSFIVDLHLVVDPNHQHRGVGANLLEALERQVAAKSATGTVQLVADGGVTGFYETLGYQWSSSRLLSKSLL